MTQTPVWKELRTPKGDKVVKYRVIEEDFVDEVIIQNNEEITIKYSIDGVLVVKSKNTEITIKPLTDDFEDPFFTFEAYFDTVDIEEAIKDIKDYILHIMEYTLSLE